MRAEVTKIQLQAEIMEQEGYDETENVEEQVTKEMEEALDGNGFIAALRTFG